MSAAHLPGGAELDTMLRQVTGKPGTIDDMAKKWREMAGDIDEFAGALSSAVQNVDNAWKGASADEFDSYMRKYGTAAANLKSALTKSATSLDNAVKAMRESHTEIGGIIRDLNTEAAKYKSDDPKITSLVTNAKSRAKTWVTHADDALEKAKGEINGYLKDRGLTFAGIPLAATQKFSPQEGEKFDWLLEWQAEPGYQQKNPPTTLQGGGSGPPGTAPASFGGYGSSGPPPPGGGPAPTGKLKEWIDEAIAILTKHGVPASKMNPNDIYMIIKHESGGNPNAINNWDSNAAKGTPSKGLMQTIDPTFNSYKLDGHGNIYDPVDNIIAGVRYAIARYGSVSNVPGVVNTKQGEGYVGY